MEFQETNGIQTGAGIKLVIYGQEGVGKTSLAAAGSSLPGLRRKHLKNERSPAAQALQLGDVAAGTRLRAGIPHTTTVSDCDHRHL